jgi:hypothetical protein
MIKKIKGELVRYRNKSIYSFYALKAKLSSKVLPTHLNANFIVSIASYPKRDPLLPAVFQALSEQTLVPKKWILVLSEEDYTNGLPSHLIKLEKRGLEVLWTKNNPFAVKKLIPTMQEYPELDVITFDDELIYGRQVIEKLVEKVTNHPKTVIGHVSKKLYRKNERLEMYYRFKDENVKIKSSFQIYFLGGSGTYYPKNSLHPKAFNLQAIHEIVPGRGSDIWFWAATVANNTDQKSLDTKTKKSLYFEIPNDKNTKPLDTPGQSAMEERFQMAIDYFGIREKLIQNLPDKI